MSLALFKKNYKNYNNEFGTSPSELRCEQFIHVYGVSK